MLHSTLKSLLGAAAIVLSAQVSAQVTFYEHENFGGRAFTAQDGIGDFRRFGFNDRASSVVVSGRPWEVCDDAGFRGHCMLLRAGSYPSLRAVGLDDRISSARAADEGRYPPPPPQPVPIVVPAPPPPPPPAFGAGQITFYQDDGFRGRVFSAEREVPDLGRFGFNDRASSVVVLGEPWEACEDANYGGRCILLRPGRYPNLAAMGMNDRLSSTRPFDPRARYDDSRYAPPPPAAYDWRRQPQERLYQVDVDSVRAVYGAPQQRCWVEREQVVQDRRGEPNVGGAVIGGLLGGILGHQIGGGSGRDLATAGGAVGGVVVGANVNRDDGNVTSIRNVRRCAPEAARGRPEYWDVAYSFRGVEHHLQATSPPGPTVTVNDAGEPRL